MFVKDDHTFNFSDKVPFFQSRKGEWFYWIDGDMEVLEYTFDEKKKQGVNITNQNVWIFEGQTSKNGSSKSKLVFIPTKQ
jgi:hypothetical protein